MKSGRERTYHERGKETILTSDGTRRFALWAGFSYPLEWVSGIGSGKVKVTKNTTERRKRLRAFFTHYALHSIGMRKLVTVYAVDIYNAELPDMDLLFSSDFHSRLATF